MGIGNRIGRPWKAALLLAVGAAGGGAALAVASVPDGNGVIHACVTLQAGSTLPATTPGNIRVIDAPTQACNTAPAGGPPPERELTWNQTGPQGPPGTPGAPGPPGKSVTVAGGHTLTLGGGQVITVGNTPSNTFTISVTPLLRPSGNAVTLKLGGTTYPLLGFSFVNQNGGGIGAGGGGGTGKVSLHEFTITRQVDKASPKLSSYCVTGQHFKNVTITVRKTVKGKVQLLTYTLHDVLISSYQVGGSGKDAVPTETLSLNFTKVSIAYSKPK